LFFGFFCFRKKNKERILGAKIFFGDKK